MSASDFPKVMTDAAAAAALVGAVMDRERPAEPDAYLDPETHPDRGLHPYVTRRTYVIDGGRIIDAGARCTAGYDSQGRIVLEFEDGTQIIRDNAFLAGIDGPEDSPTAPRTEIELWRAYRRQDELFLHAVINLAEVFLQRIAAERRAAQPVVSSVS